MSFSSPFDEKEIFDFSSHCCAYCCSDCHTIQCCKHSSNMVESDCVLMPSTPSAIPLEQPMARPDYPSSRRLSHPQSFRQTCKSSRLPLCSQSPRARPQHSYHQTSRFFDRHMRSNLRLRMMAKMAAISFVILFQITPPTFLVVEAHGYLKSPRSRNLVAYQDKKWDHEGVGGRESDESDVDSSRDPMPEDCPHCLNRGGTLSQCGILTGTDPKTQLPWERNYDFPQNYLGETMPVNLQATYQEGDTITLEILVTTHHKGHFEFSLCPIIPLSEFEDVPPLPLEGPTAECFSRHKLTFVEDVLYGANGHQFFPERAYLAPASMVEWVQGSPEEQPVIGARYVMKMRLPEGLTGEMVLLQWYYLTANSCKHEGYESYEWPEHWGEDVKLYKGLPDCGELPEDGNGVPEQFWNCAEIKIESNHNSSPSGVSPFVETLLIPSPTPPVQQAPPASAPTYKLCPHASYNYYQATEDCTGYIYCFGNVPDAQTYSCGDGFLYDEGSQRCNWADQVTACGSAASGSPPTPTPPPVRPPNPLLDWDYHNLQGARDRSHDKTIIGYYASWQWYDRNGLAAPINMDFKKITRANFAFFQITTDGDIYGTDSWADPITLFGPYDWMAEPGQGHEYCSWDSPDEPSSCSAHNYQEGLIYLAHKAGTEVYPSIGGWSLSDPFPTMAANPTARKHFANQCVELIKRYNFDGIDIDWEYPGYEPHSGTPDDTVNFNLLLDDLRTALDALGLETGRSYGLTAALPCGPSVLAKQDIAHVSMRLTELNLMTYDFFGSWNELTGVNAPLYDQEGQENVGFSVHGCVENWVAGGAVKEKINIGFPFYGRSFIGAQALYEPHEGADTSTFSDDEGSPQYYNIVNKFSSFTSVRDDLTHTQYAFSKKSFVSFDDERAICDKTEYAMDHGLNGYIIWELSGDLMDDKSTPLLDAANLKLADATMNCTEFSSISGIAAGAISSDTHAQKYYPDYGVSRCVSDGAQPDWLGADSLFEAQEPCCLKFFDWNPNCVTQPKSASSTTTKATTTSTTSKTTVTSATTTTTATASKMTTTHYSSPTPQTTTSASAANTPTSTISATVHSANANAILGDHDVTKNNENISFEFWPIFQNDGTSTLCQQGGEPPSWMKPSAFKKSLSDCCHSYAFSWEVHSCIENSPGHVIHEVKSPNSLNSLNAEKLRYYPDFENFKCNNEENRGTARSVSTQYGWMSEDYFQSNLKKCCNTFFSQTASYASCLGA